MPDDQILCWEHRAAQAGPTLLVTGAVHGNEICGTAAIGRLQAELASGTLTLAAGTLALAPICNPEAYRRNARFVEANLNRVVARHAQPANYEERLANQLTRLIDRCDVLLDLHSYHAGQGAFLFLDYVTPANCALADAANIAHRVVGWADLYEGQADLSAGDTTMYAHHQGKDAVLIECGTHLDPLAPLVGYQGIRGILAQLGMMAWPERPARLPAHYVRMEKVFVYDRPGKLTRSWQHLDPVPAGTVIARYEDGQTITAASDGVMILPKEHPQPGHEWFYLGRAITETEAQAA